MVTALTSLSDHCYTLSLDIKVPASKHGQSQSAHDPTVQCKASPGRLLKPSRPICSCFHWCSLVSIGTRMHCCTSRLVPQQPHATCRQAPNLMAAALTTLQNCQACWLCSRALHARLGLCTQVASQAAAGCGTRQGARDSGRAPSLDRARRPAHAPGLELGRHCSRSIELPCRGPCSGGSRPRGRVCTAPRQALAHPARHV